MDDMDLEGNSNVDLPLKRIIIPKFLDVYL